MILFVKKTSLSADFEAGTKKGDFTDNISIYDFYHSEQKTVKGINIH
ncbi:hypothetical protein D2M30_4261 [Bacillus amyloliquefaciens]|nr:hypothetical protein D2M30_4261 [Bacillus amyloliquefaciens]